MQGLRTSNNCTAGYLQLTTEKNEVSKENGYLVGLGCQVVELSCFVSVRSPVINRVLSSTAELPRDQLSLGLVCVFRDAAVASSPPGHFFKLRSDSPNKALGSWAACEEAFASLAPVG